MDVDAIDPGEDFAEVVEQKVGSCDVLIALIGRSWVTSTDREGRRRLHKPHDWVRQEIQTALERRDTRVIPALVQGAEMPAPDELPAAAETLPPQRRRAQGPPVGRRRCAPDQASGGPGRPASAALAAAGRNRSASASGSAAPAGAAADRSGRPRSGSGGDGSTPSPRRRKLRAGRDGAICTSDRRPSVSLRQDTRRPQSLDRRRPKSRYLARVRLSRSSDSAGHCATVSRLTHRRYSAGHRSSFGLRSSPHSKTMRR
jgi:hypothetical protein